MNEEPLQIYLNLIEELLNCPQGEEPKILQENEELINQEFIQIANQYADWLEQQQPEGNNAAFLRNIARTLTEYLNRKGNLDFGQKKFVSVYFTLN